MFYASIQFVCLQYSGTGAVFSLVNFVMMYQQLQPLQEERAKFGYKSVRTVDILENPVMFWQPPTTRTTPTTKCLNMVTSMFFSSECSELKGI
jgi:hypothetical protein